jgi:hypothetical protein
MKRTLVAFSLLLFFSGQSTYSMGLFRAIKKMAMDAQQEQQDPTLFQDPTALVAADVKNAFAQTNLPSVLLAIIFNYCPDELSKVLTITLPDAKKPWYMKDFIYPKFSAVNVSFDGALMRVLNTHNRYLFFRLPEGVLVSEQGANIPFPRLKEEHNGSVFVDQTLIKASASNDYFEVKIVGDMHDLKNHKDNTTAILGMKDFWGNYRKYDVRGFFYYDNSAELAPDYQQPRTTIEVRQKTGRTVFARILNIDIADKQQQSHVPAAAEGEKNDEDDGGDGNLEQE